jgi:hypothetical protein
MLKPSEREKLQDCLLLIESARSILLGIKPGIVPHLPEIQKCFRDADQTLSRLLAS